jgi:epoxyqueuosine reductase QueG
MDNKVIERLIVDFVSQYPTAKKVETQWLRPLVGFASAAHPLFDRFKDIIHADHLTPKELLPEAKSVVAFFIPFRPELQRENYREEHHCSRSWAVAYIETNQLISDTTAHVKKEVATQGIKAADVPPTHNFDEQTLMSNWSHRHMAYVAGIGQFGQHNLLITEKGCTGRLGSFVLDFALTPTPSDSSENCLHKAGFECLKCVDRCQYDALFEDRFDRFACHRQCKGNDRFHEDLGLVEICGKCASMVPCSTANPVQKKDKKVKS